MQEHGSHIPHMPYRHNPHELHLRPVQPIDFSQRRSVSDMLHAMAETPFGSREVGQAADVLEEMVRDKDTFVVMTLSGAMTPGGMGLLITEMIDRDMVQAVVSTGALMAHEFVQSAGMDHYWAEQGVSDEQWAKRKMNRIYRVLEPETNLDHVEEIFNSILDTTDDKKVYSSREFTHLLGEYLDQTVTGRGILKSAHQKGVPVYVPAFFDSELGLDVGLRNEERAEQDLPPIQYNDAIDLMHYSELIRAQALRGKKLGIFTIGGGVPRNWAQQVGPYLELQADRFQSRHPDKPRPITPMFSYGVRICPDDVNLGGLSGCTYEEGKSWRKFDPNAKTAEVLQDAMVTWPWIIEGVLQRLDENPADKKAVFAGKEAIAETTTLVDRRFNPNLNQTIYNTPG